jgi:hypothetical protein
MACSLPNPERTGATGVKLAIVTPLIEIRL